MRINQNYFLVDVFKFFYFEDGLGLCWVYVVNSYKKFQEVLFGKVMMLEVDVLFYFVDGMLIMVYFFDIESDFFFE